MAHRTFKDRYGRDWEVWEVKPTMAERRASTPQEGDVPLDRRKRDEARASLPGNLHKGWLAFESKAERRRLSPVPEGWAEVSDDELAELVEHAISRGKPRRLIE